MKASYKRGVYVYVKVGKSYLLPGNSRVYQNNQGWVTQNIAN